MEQLLYIQAQILDMYVYVSFVIDLYNLIGGIIIENTLFLCICCEVFTCLVYLVECVAVTGSTPYIPWERPPSGYTMLRPLKEGECRT